MSIWQRGQEFTDEASPHEHDDPLSERKRVPTLTFDATPTPVRTMDTSELMRAPAREVLILGHHHLGRRDRPDVERRLSARARQLLDNRDAYLEVRNL